MSIAPPDEIVHIKVKEATFVVHKQLLSECSSYLMQVCAKSAGGQNPQKPIDLDELKDIEPIVFQEMLSWLYHGDLSVRPGPPHQWREMMISLWLLGEKLAIPNLQNSMLLTLSDESGQLMGVELVCQIYKATQDGSPLRLYAVNTWAWYAEEHHLKEFQDSMPTEFKTDLMIFLAKMRNEEHPDIIAECVLERYLIHPDAKE